MGTEGGNRLLLTAAPRRALSSAPPLPTLTRSASEALNPRPHRAHRQKGGKQGWGVRGDVLAFRKALR